MTVKDIVKLAAVLLGRENVAAYEVDCEADSSTLYQVDVFTRCVNLVVSELAGTYVPMVSTEEVGGISDTVKFSDLAQTPLKILSAYSTGGEELRLSFYPEHLKANMPVDKVTYRYIPANYGFTDTVGYQENQVSMRVLAYGAAAEYCLTERLFEDACAWHKKYMDGIAEICSPKNVTIKKRSFV